MSDANPNPELVPIQSPVRETAITSKKKFHLSETQIVLIVLGIIIFLTILVYIALALSSRRTSTDTPPPTGGPTPVAIVGVTPQPIATSTPLPTVTSTPTPTPKPSPTPTPTPSPTPTPTPTPSPQVKTITQGAGQDGYVDDSPAVHVTDQILVGRTPSVNYRGFVGFDIAEIPATATITKATLRLYQYSVNGSPYSTIGSITVDHLDFGTTLDTDDYSGGNVYQSSIGTIGSAQLAEWKTMDVTAQVKKDRSTHTSSQFRLHFTGEAHGGSDPGDFVTFSNPSASGTSDLPQLVVEYHE